MWINYLANDKTCLNCEVESDSRPEANDHLSKYHLNLIVEEIIKTSTTCNPDDEDLDKTNDTN